MWCKRLLPFLLVFPFAIGSIEPYDDVVSLGSACQPAWYFKGYGMRRSAYPFDWLVTPFEGLISFIINKGDHFLEKENLRTLEVLGGDPPILHVVDVKYDIHIVHDFYFDMQNYDKIKTNYKRRIERFFKLLESNKRVLFVRVQMNRSEAQVLDALFQRLYPKLDYTIVAVSDEPDAEHDWGFERIKNYYMKQTPGEWMGDGDKWREILYQFTIKEKKKHQSDEEKG